MTRNDLYAAAFRYKKTKIWKKLSESEIFAIRLRNGETGYISIMGEYGELCAIGLYIGDEGFRSYRLVAESGNYIDSEIMFHNVMMQQNCLQMMLVGKDDLFPEEVEEARAYAKEHGIRLSGRNAYPQFVKCEPNRLPWKMKNEADYDALYDALEAAEPMAALLKTAKPEELGIFDVSEYSTQVPLFEIRGGKLEREGYAILPKEREPVYDPVPAVNEIAVASVKKLKKAGVWESELIRVPIAAQEDPEEAPYYPSMLIVVESESGFMLPQPPVIGADYDPQVMLQEFANALKTMECRPKEIRCRDERTFALIGDFCRKAGIKCSVYEGEMAALDECEDAMLDHFAGFDGGESEDEFGDEFDDEFGGPFADEPWNVPGEALGDASGGTGDPEIDEALMILLGMSREELRMLPKPLIRQVKAVIKQGLLPEEIAAKLSEKLKGI